MTWEELEEVRKGKLHIEIIKDELRLIDDLLLPSKADSVGSSSSPSSPVEQHFRRKQELEEKLKREQQDLIDKMLKVERWLSTVKDNDIVLIVRNRFILGRSWNKVSRVIWGFADRTNAINRLKYYLSREV